MPGILTFPLDEAQALLADAERAWAANKQVRTYCGEYDEPGFWLVGDRGIYLMHNGELSGDEMPMTVFSKESNPDKDPNDYYEAKRRIFGGDDGVEHFPVAMVEAWISQATVAYLHIKVTKTKVVLL